MCQNHQGLLFKKLYHKLHSEDGGFLSGMGLEHNMLFFESSLCYSGFPGGSAGKESACNARDLGSIPGLGRSPGEGKGYPFQYSGLENSMDSPWGCKESDTTERLSLSLCYSETQTGECSSKKEASDLLSLYNISLQEQNK